jgi:hypothetical protein
MLASNGFITANQTYELGSGQNLMLQYLFNNNQTAYDNYIMLSELLLQAEMELGSENSGLAESQTQKASRKTAESEAEKEALNSAAVTNAESVEVEEATVSETSQTAESSLEKSVNGGVTEDKVSAQEEETLGKEAGTQSQSVSENETAKQKKNTSGNEGVYFNQSGEGGRKTIDYIQLSEDLGKKIEADGYKLIDIEDALTANRDWADMEYNLPPVAEGTKAYNVEAGNFQYARVFKEGVNRPKSPFLLRADDISGLTAEQIAQKYALPQIPDKVVYPNIPSTTPLEVSIVGPQETWGTLGGDVQYAIKDVMLDDSWFTDIHDLK